MNTSNLMKSRFAAAAMIAGCLISQSASAAVVLNVGPTMQDRFTGTSASLGFTTQTANNSILVVATATKDVGTSGGTNSVSAITFDSQNFVPQVQASDTIRHFQIWTLDLGNETGVSGNIAVTLADAGESAFFAYQISNATLTGVLTNSGADSNSPFNFIADLTGVAAGSFIVDLGMTNNNFSNLTSTGAGRTGSLAVSDLTEDPAAMTSYITNWVGGDATLGYNSDSRGGMVSAAFAPVPEPASLALMGLGGLMMVLRSRRDRA